MPTDAQTVAQIDPNSARARIKTWPAGKSWKGAHTTDAQPPNSDPDQHSAKTLKIYQCLDFFAIWGELH